MKRSVPDLCRNADGAVAPTVALSLLALVAIAGVGFDYARLATMDTELQNAADQAALAAAAQLDRNAGACARAAEAASAMVTNQTLFARKSGGDGLDITVYKTGFDETACDDQGNVRFYQDKEKTTAATTDANARFVEVQVNSRVAAYALTPIVAVFQSPAIGAIAFAGVGSAVCKVPPLMMCAPAGGFDPNDYKGVGLKLFEGGGGSWAPGAFGYLNVGAANNGTPDQRVAMGFNNAALTCVSESTADVDTGVSASVLDALNTRFDIFQNGWARNTCLPSNNCSPAFNTTKDLVRTTGASVNANSCGIANNSEWQLPTNAQQYLPSNDAGDDSNGVVQMGYPMDICHYAGRTACPDGRLGDGSWRPDIYFKANHPTQSNADGSNWQTATGLGTGATRYDFYMWEQSGGGANRPSANNGGFTQHGSPVCKPPGLAAGPSQPDRRVITVAVVTNCDEINGSSSTVDVGTWAEVFLTQPVVSRDGAGIGSNEIYVEIIGEARVSGDGTNAQLVRRDVPYLIE